MSSQHNKRVQYSPSKMRAAIEMVRSNGMAKAKAAKLFGVPRTTLLDKLTGRVPEEATRPGPQSVLTPAEEKTLVRYTVLMAKIGYPLTRKELLYETKRILDIDGRKTVFKDNLPGKGWFKAFKMRNPEMAERTPAVLGYHRAAITIAMIKGWYDGLYSFLEKEIDDHTTMVSDPRRVFNADESGFPISVKSSKVLAPSGSRHVYQVLPGDKTQITVMACLNAFGDYMSPLIIYPGQRIRDTVLSGFQDAIYGTSKNGWMDSDLFVAFLEHFDQFISEKQITRPVLLIVDGHSTHMSLPAATFCAEHGIILYCLLANATHVLQACDIGLFSPMKTKWRQLVKEWQMKLLGECFTKTHFPEVFKSTWDSVATLSNSINAFRRSGLFPLSPKGIDESKLSPSEILVDDVATTAASAEVATSSVPSEADTSVEDPTNVATPSAVANVVVHETTNMSATDLAATSEPRPTVPSTSASIEIMQNPSDLELSRTVTTASTSTVAGNSTSQGNLNGQSSTSKILRPKGDPNFVSPAFHHLRVPELKKKKVGTFRNKLPKALSGSTALKMLKEREENKRKEEEEKLARKVERERKKRERDDEKERKKREREIKKKIKLLKKQKQRDSSDSDSTEENIPFMDDSDDDNGVRCPVCLSGEGAEWEWVGCEVCPLWYHIDCTGREDFFGKRAGSLRNVYFVCENCDP